MTFPRRPFAAWLRVLALCLLLLGSFSLPTRAASICCRCTIGGDPTITCVKGTATSCAELKANSTNDVLKSATCQSTALTATECLTQAQQGICQLGPVDSATFGKPTAGIPEQTPALVPELNVKIPGLTFATTLGEDKGYLTIPFFAQYISAIYKFLIVASAIAAAIMIVYGGFLYIAGGAVPQIKRGREIIVDAIIGLLLILGVYVILNTVNPELLNLQPLRVQRITTMDYTLMTRGPGFKNTEGAADNERLAESQRSSGNAPLVAAQEGENVSIEDINAQGKAPARLNAYCTSKADAAQLKTFAEKTQALVRVILGWKKTCVDEKGCAYLRAGYTSIPSGDTQLTLLDPGYVVPTLNAFDGGPKWGFFCDAAWSLLGSTFYDPIVPKSNSKEDKEAAQKERKEKYGLFLPGGTCYDTMKESYATEFADRYEEQGIFGGDCGTTLVQIYECAGAKMARGSAATYLSGAVFTSLDRPEGRDIVVWYAKDWNDYVRQVNEAGGLRFGDIFSVGQKNWQHNFIYTGGREDVPFDWFEMGSSGRDGLIGTAIPIKGLNAPVGGMYAWPKGTPPDYFLELAKKRGKSIFPIFVWRPYDYEPCESRSQCAVGQSCHCAVSDIPNLGSASQQTISNTLNNVIKTNKCSMDGICHEVKPLGCETDEQCPKGYYCKNKEKGFLGAACTLGEPPPASTP